MVIENSGSLFTGLTRDDSGNPISDWKWLIENGTRVHVSSELNNTSTTLYSVPAGNVFYLMSAQVACWNEAAISGGRTIGRIDAGGTAILTVSCGENDNAHDNAALAFPFPVPFPNASGSFDITLDSNRSNFYVRGAIIGFTVKL